MVRSALKRPGNDTAAGRLREFVDRHPDARWRLTLSEVAHEIGVSRQMAFVLLPRWTQERQRLQIDRVRAFARQHLKARLSARRKRLDWPQIAVEMGLPVSTVRRLWRASGLPPKDRLDREAIKLRRAERQRRYLARVLWPETCVMCGANFAWTMQHERTRRYFGRSVTCSKSCGQRFHSARSNKH